MTQQPPFCGNVRITEADEEPALEDLNVFRDDQRRISIQFGDGTLHRDVLVRRAAPLTDPEHYVVFLDAQGRELCVVRDPRRLSPDAQAAVKTALDQHYLSSQVTAILSLRIEGEVCYFEAETSRGRRHFVVSTLQQGLRRLGGRKLLFVDAEGNRFEIDDFERLDRRSVVLLNKVL